MVIGGPSKVDKAAREAVLALLAALAAHRQHPDAPGLCLPAKRRAVAALAHAAEASPLAIGIHAGALHLGEHAVAEFHRDEAPFGLLRNAGIGELVIAKGSPPTDCEQLLTHLCSLASSNVAEQDLMRLLDSTQLPGIKLHATADHPTAPLHDQANWDALPPAEPTTVAVRAMVQGDESCNLPALAARQLLDDCERTGATHGGLLDRLMQRMLDNDDVATITWLLTEAQRQAAFHLDVVQRLTAMARRHCDQNWLTQRLEQGTTDELLQLSSLVMQLGDDVAEQFANAAAAVAHPLSQWLGELLRS